MKELINAKDILIRTKILAQNISREHQGDKTPVVMVGLLNGAFMFYADLVRGMSIDIECDFMRVKSYHNKKQGDIQITKDLEIPIKGKDVYIVDDIYDSGNTISAVTNYLQVKRPKFINIVTLLTRHSSPKPTIPSYHGKTIGDEWLVGYGMDNSKGYMRNSPDIYAI